MLSFYVKGMYEVIILDVEMPELNGLETAERIRQIDKSVIISFLTNYAEFAVQGYDVGAFLISKNQPDYVYKNESLMSLNASRDFVLSHLLIKTYHLSSNLLIFFILKDIDGRFHYSP